MTVAMWVFVVAMVLRTAALVWMVVGALWFLREAAGRRVEDLDETWFGRIRRRVNPAVRGGLWLIASGGIGLAALTLLDAMILFGYREDWRWLVHLDGGPEPIGHLGYSAGSVLSAVGVCILIRGVRALVVPNASGRMPAVLAPKPGSSTR